MENRLLCTFRDFDNLAHSRLQRLEERAIEGAINKFATEAMLPFIVNELEEQDQFRNLLLETQSSFAGDQHSTRNEKAWRDAIHNYFCQSGYYLDLVDRKVLNIDTFFNEYCEAFKRREADTIYLAPIEFFNFAQDHMDFGNFKIKRFSLRELDGVLRNRVNKLFYPNAYFTKEKLELLSQYWFIQVTVQGSVPEIGSLMAPSSNLTTLILTGLAERCYTDYPVQIESALKILCLFDWAALYREDTHKKGVTSKVISDEKDEYDLYARPKIPFVIEIDQNLFSGPYSIPNLSEIDSTFYIYLGKDETEVFIQFTNHINGILHSLEISKNGWDFLKISLGYFTKAFCTQPSLEQLLWHITTLEALLLLDEEQEGLTGRLAKRISSILGKDENEKKIIAKRFRELYDVRSSLVHGKTKAEAHITGLVDAYRFSRRALLWFLHYLGDIQNRITKGETTEGVPTHKEILTLLDIDTGSRNRVQWLMKGLPREFPYMNEWIK